MATSRRLLLSTTIALIAACGDSGTGDRTNRTPAAYATGTVHDSTGAPLPYTAIWWRATPAPDSSTGSIDDYGVQWYLRTDSLGRFAINLGYFSIDQLDSLYLIVGDGPCSPFSLDTLLALGQSLTGPTDTAFYADVTLRRGAQADRWAPGPGCAKLVDPQPDGTGATFQLWVDSIGGSGTTWGRFRINYATSVGDDFGTLVGLRSGDSLVAVMTHGAPWGICTDYRLAVAIGPDSEFVGGHYTSANCPTYDWPLQFIAREELPWVD